MEENQKGLEIKDDIKDYPHFNFVKEESAEGSSKEINLSQFNIFIQFKKACINEKIIPNFDYFDDYYLLKFCRARNYNLEKIIKMFKKYLSWRIENDVENIDSFNFIEFDDVLKVYPHGFHKIDKEGHPIYYHLINKLNAKQLFTIATSERFFKYLIQTYENMMKYKFTACSKYKGELIESTCVIMDIGGFGISDFFGKIQDFIKLGAKLGQDYYPCNMAKMFLINTNRFFGLIYNIIKGLIDIKTRKKIEILGNEYKEKVFEFIEPENLPTFLGGTCTCPHVPGGCLYCDIGPWNPRGKIYKYRGEDNIAPFLN